MLFIVAGPNRYSRVYLNKDAEGPFIISGIKVAKELSLGSETRVKFTYHKYMNDLQLTILHAE